MPEGHVLHRLATRLNRDFRDGGLTVTSPQGRFADQAALLDGHLLDIAEALGKHLFLHFVNAPSVYVHLGLIGTFRFEDPVTQKGQIRLRILNHAETLAAHLRGPQACRLLEPGEAESIRERSGEDPLRADADPAKVTATARRTRRSIAAVLMDQSVYAGVGNIYRAETLFRLGISPFTPANQLSEKELTAIWEDLVATMRVGEETGRIDTVRDEHRPEAMGRPPRIDEHGGEVYVYRRAGDPCLICGTEIEHTMLQGRNLFYCPRCQNARCQNV
ncbi:DNA glycosylase [Corynebacterium yudongzhengii]|uniref:DNA-(apurinic or apyrimidinic site) lyase n=1 Tax=Corynebacterium yudongzhengii TaxID=2080740 RepID=A0A2U1T443_9CORY|nr:zinc finger domain-containing protein [Corynebacterium yudongzhengii]AWB82844.1 DNA glycosylase [Corynebacterium yudongzhengii]PWC00753.1 Fpg/Nei family DNA glycosylase [Corynebacterium yudongzhengii]